MNEKIKQEPLLEDSKDPGNDIYSPEGHSQHEFARITDHEFKLWKELYPKLDIRKTLEKIADLIKLEHATTTITDNFNTKTGSWEEWDGNVSFWGVKRIFVMLFDPNRESNEIFASMPEAVKEEIKKIDLSEYLKENK